MSKYLAVLIGSAFGGLCRYSLSNLVYFLVKEPTFPYANFIINVSGSFLIGFLAEWFDTRVMVSPVLRIALLTGVLGGYTTFSSFSFETYALLRDGEMVRGVVNAAGSVLIGLLAVFLGVRLAQSL